jgi:S1-C subfamily serine protease
LHDQQSFKAKLIGADAETDIALLKIDTSGLTFIPYGNSDDVVVGEWVLAVGNPFNLASTVTAGIVSAKARNINIADQPEGVQSFIQTDAAINPGNSGGALVNVNGELIGINSAIATPTGAYAGYSFAVPVNIVKKVGDDLMNFGEVKRAYLGIIIRDMSTAVAKEQKLKFSPGVFIDSVLMQSSAMDAGLKAGDIITELEKTKITTSPQLQELIAMRRPGETIEMKIIRDGTERKITVKLKGKPAPVASKERVNAAAVKALGIEVRELTEKEKQETGLENGLVVVDISKGKVRDFTTMKRGFIMTKVNGTVVRNPEDLISIVKHTKDGKIMIEGTYPGSNVMIYYGFGL